MPIEIFKAAAAGSLNCFQTRVSSCGSLPAGNERKYCVIIYAVLLCTCSDCTNSDCILIIFAHRLDTCQGR